LDSQPKETIMKTRKYIAVCAARDEEKFIKASLLSVLNQTIPPELCILSDDGSKDDTPFIAENVGAVVIHNYVDRHNMKEINQVIALKIGIAIATKEVPDWEFLLKFDGDTKIPPTYVEHLLDKMEENPQLGVCSGRPEGEKIRLARASDAAKIYRRGCWDDIKGLDMCIAFDSHALLKASQAGWDTGTISTITFKEMRPSGVYGLRRWILTGFERATFGLPLYHTIFASLKNVKRGSPPILNAIATIFSHIINPWPKAPNLDHEWIKNHYAINEIRFFINEIIGARGTKG